MIWHCAHDLQLEIDTKPLVMGILNVTPDSFSDGGSHLTVELALRHVQTMLHDGVDIIDIGGESTRPGAEKVPTSVEIERVLPVIMRIRQFSAIPISIDTTKLEVAKAALDAGANIINDVSAFRFAPNIAQLAKETRAGCVLMHMQGTPQTMQVDPHYENVMGEICNFFAERIQFSLQVGLSKEQLVLDPGIGFGKRTHHNLLILKELGQLRQFGLPVLLGASRKGLIERVTGRPIDQRLAGTLAIHCDATSRGTAHIWRVHDVREAVDAAKMLEAILNAEIY
ncbi:MAG: dihydropteroate synthase [Zavarzinella sp.]